MVELQWSGGTAAHNGLGGRGGDGHVSNDGGGGGAASIVKVAGTIIGGAGGGGGGGGFGEACGQDGLNANSPTDDVMQVPTGQGLFTGTGGTGGNMVVLVAEEEAAAVGCGPQGTGIGGSSGLGGGQNGSGGHEEGYGGRRGISAVKTDWFDVGTLVSGNTVTGDGYAKVTVTEDRGYWTPGGGGGGIGGFRSFELPHLH